MKEPTYRSILRDEVTEFRQAIPVFWAQQEGLWAKLTGVAFILWDSLGILWRALVTLPITFALQSMSRKIYPTVAAKLQPNEAALYGPELAAKVTKRLRSMKAESKKTSWPLGMANVHRDYCGHAIQWIAGKICIGHADDGVISLGRIILDFDTPEAFEAWLGVQSDLSLGGLMPDTPFTDYQYAGNQRITRERLEAFAAKRPLGHQP